MLRPASLRAPVAASFLALALAPVAAGQVLSTATSPFPNFESSPVDGLLVAPDGRRLYALNTPDARLEVYSLAGGGAPSYVGSVFTGLEPVAMCLHPDDPTTLFVSNHLSDSVAVVDLATLSLRATVNVGDEPQGLAVAAGKLFVATARAPLNPGTVDPGAFVENAVVVLQAAAPYSILARVAIPAVKPRALVALERSGSSTVYVVPQNSGNHSTTLGLEAAQNAGLGDPTTPAPGEAPFATNPTLKASGFSSFGLTQFLNNGWLMPDTSRVVLDSDYPSQVPQLADLDVLAIDAATNQLLPGGTTGVGTTLFDAAFDPLTGALWVANTEARNRTRFEPVLKGQALENRVTLVTPGGAVVQVIELAPPFCASEHAQPVAIAFYAPPQPDPGSAGAGSGGSGTGSSTTFFGQSSTLPGGPTTSGSGPYSIGPRPTAYVAALGTASVVAIDTLTGALIDEIATAQMPVALAVDPRRALLYVQTRGDKRIHAYDIAHGHAEIGLGTPLAYDPEPAGVTIGRQHLYDARGSSGHGTNNFSCAGCHVSGNSDFLSWDLGDPEGGLGYFFPDEMTGDVSHGGETVAAKTVNMTHPMKGPMLTQSLRGMFDSKGPPLHWRGDRRFFQMFQGAFKGLLGGSGITNAEMQQYATFARSLAFPPNPYEPRDRVYTGAAASGKSLFGMNASGKSYTLLDNSLKCITCHEGNFAAESDFTGSQATANFDQELQLFNSATLRGGYEKFYRNTSGFGFLHDGSKNSVADFLGLVDQVFGVPVFNLLTTADKSNLDAFVKAWDSGTPPLTGTQASAQAGTTGSLGAWLDLAEAQCKAPVDDVDLVAHLATGTASPVQGFVFLPAANLYQRDDGTSFTRSGLLAEVAGSATIAFTAVPRGTGTRLGVDRDEDGLLDGIERSLGTNPADPDTDLDGYTDAYETSNGGDPLVPEPSLADALAPVIQLAQIRDVATKSATLRLQTDEPATTLVELGLAPGVYTYAAFSGTELRRVHDVILDGLPAFTTVYWRAQAFDRNGNPSSTTGSFQTGPRLFHVDDITLVASPSGAQWTATATVTVVDQDGAPVSGCDVRGVWTGSIGGQQFFPTADTNASGVATFTLTPYSPTLPTVLSFGVAYIGSTVNGDPFYVGAGGATNVSFFYQQPANAVNYRSVTIP